MADLSRFSIPKDKFRRFRIESDGTYNGTKVYDALTGEPVYNASEVHISITPKGVEAEIKLLVVPLNFIGGFTIEEETVAGEEESEGGNNSVDAIASAPAGGATKDEDEL